MKTGAPGEIRTPDLQLRRLPLYPAELRARAVQFTCGVGRHQMRTARRTCAQVPISGDWLRKLPAVATAPTAAALAPASTASATTATFRFGPCFVHVQGASANLRAIQCRNRFLSVLGTCHLDKTETARAPCVPVSHDADAIHLPMHFKELAQFFFRCVEIQVSNEDVLQASASGVSYLSVEHFGGEAGGA